MKIRLNQTDLGAQNAYASNVKINLDFFEKSLKITGNLEIPYQGAFIITPLRNDYSKQLSYFFPGNEFDELTNFFNSFEPIVKTYFLGSYNAENNSCVSNSAMNADDLAFSNFWYNLINANSFNLNSIKPVFNIELDGFVIAPNGSSIFTGPSKSFETGLPIYMSSRGAELIDLIPKLGAGPQKTNFENKKVANQSFFNSFEPVLSVWMRYIFNR